jgi:hypothetical protein
MLSVSRPIEVVVLNCCVRSSAAPEVVGIFPNEATITRLVGAILLEQNDEWAVQRARYMTLETIAPLRDDLRLMLPACRMTRAARPAIEIPGAHLLHHAQGHDRCLFVLLSRAAAYAGSRRSLFGGVSLTDVQRKRSSRSMSFALEFLEEDVGDRSGALKVAAHGREDGRKLSIDRRGRVCGLLGRFIRLLVT